MKRLDLGQGITVIANLGVIAGIVLLAYEMQQNTVAVRSAASQGVQDQITAIYTMLQDDPMAEIFAVGMGNPERLDPIETVKLRAYLSNVFNAFENMWAQAEDGALDEARARGYWQLIRNLMEFPFASQHWDDRSFIYSEKFRSFVEDDVMTLDPAGGTLLIDAAQ